MKKIFLALSFFCATMVAQNPLATGLVAYFGFESNSKDYLGLANGVDGSTTYQNGLIYKDVFFNGTNAYIQCATECIPLGAKSICFWAKPSNSTAFAAVLGNNQINSGNHGTEIFGTSGGGATYQFFLGSGTGNYFSLTSPTYTVGSWNFFCFTWDGTTSANMVKAYVNAGTPTTATSSSTETVHAPFNLWLGSLISSNYYTGYMDDLMIFNRALSTADISFLYNSGLGVSYYQTQSAFFKLGR